MRPIPLWMWEPRTFVFIGATREGRRFGQLDRAVIDQAAELPAHHFLWIGRDGRPAVIER